MSISRKDWSALSSLTRQWTVEDEEEVERERRRRVKSSSSTADLDSDLNQTARDTPTADGTRGTDAANEVSQGLSSEEQLQLDFVEMLRMRDEKRRLRHVEALMRQKEEDEAGSSTGGGSRAGVDEGGRPPSVSATSEPVRTLKTTPHSPAGTTLTNTQHKNTFSPGDTDNHEPPSTRTRKFVSSMSISLDRTPSVSECSTPMSPRSPTDPFSPEEHWPSPCQSPTPAAARSPVQSQHTQEAGVNGSFSGASANFEQTAKPAFHRKSSRTVSFRMMRKKEEESTPMQRSASVRMASKKLESNMDQNQEEDKPSSFQRNSRQRVSSRSIQEKMERLAQAAQKSEMLRSPEVAHRILVLHDEVSRKRGLYEQKASCPTSPGVSRQEFRGFASGISERINRWISKANQHGSSHSSRDVTHVDINSKRSLFEREDNIPKANNEKFHK